MFFSKALQMDDTLGNLAPASSGTIDWNNVINQGFALASQAFNSFGGQTVGTQFGSNASRGGIFVVEPANRNYDDRYSYVPTNAAGANQTGGVGGTVGSGVDGIFNWMLSNPLPVFLGIGGIYLLMREPPRRR